MTKVQIIVELTIDDDLINDVNTILTEMYYHFSYINEENYELITNAEILEQLN